MPPVSRPLLVTGAGGFVGSAVFRALARRVGRGGVPLAGGGRATRVVGVLRPGGSRARLDELEAHEGWELAEVDLTDLLAARSLVERLRPRAILHLALEGAVHDPMPDDRLERLVIAPLETLVDALAAVDGDRFVHTGSAWVLPPGTDLDESAPLEPVTPYATAKAREDRRLLELGRETGVPWINLRLFNVFGRYEPASRLLPYLVDRLSRSRPAELSDGDRVRDFNDVDDMARAYLLALRAGEEACGRVYHVGSGRGTTVRQFAAMVADVTGNRDLIRFGGRTTADEHMDRLVADPGRARRELGWRVPAPLEERVRAAAEWWASRLRETADERAG